MTQEKKPFEIKISDRLRDVLLEFESESEVARLLLSKDIGQLVEDPINYISVSEQDPSRISYLSTDRVKKIENEFPEPEYNTEGVLWASGIRFHARPGSFITKIFKNVSPKEVEKFSNLYRSNINKPKFKLEVVSGDLIKDYYHYDIYAGGGTLGNSCMKHDSCQRFFEVYTKNPEIVSMLVMLNEGGLLMGRALLWTYESYKIMDRIYTTCDEELSFYFKKWATDNGYLYKSEQNWFNTMSFESLGNKKRDIKIDISLKNNSIKYFPYVDTFKWINTETNTLHNYIPNVSNKRDIKTLASSEGTGYDYDYIILDSIDNMHRYRNECNFVSYLNIYTYQGNINYSDINDKWILCKDAIFDEDLGDYLFNEEHNHLNNMNAINERRDLIHQRRERRKLEEEEDLKRRMARNQSSGIDVENIMGTLSEYLSYRSPRSSRRSSSQETPSPTETPTGEASYSMTADSWPEII